MRGLLEAHAARELFEFITTNDQLTRLPINVAEPSLPGDNAVETARFYRRVDVSSLTSWYVYSAPL